MQDLENDGPTLPKKYYGYNHSFLGMVLPWLTMVGHMVEPWY